MIEISVDELREDFEKYICKVEDGDVLVITRDGKAVARILPEGLDRKILPPWNPTAVNRGPGLVSDLISQERKEGY